MPCWRHFRPDPSSSTLAMGSCRRPRSRMWSRCCGACGDETDTTMRSAKIRVIRVIVGLAITAAIVAALLVWRVPGLYLWVKAIHVIAVISWMAGMLYLPRLFVYHCDAEPGSRQSETFKVMEHRLLTIIINPAMVATWALGLWLAFDSGAYKAGWLHAKV